MKRTHTLPPSKVISIAKIEYPKRPRVLKSAVEARREDLTTTGQITPIIVSAGPDFDKKESYIIRLGTDVLEGARLLKWRKIKAIVIPHDCPVPQAIDFWVDILNRYMKLEMTDYDLAVAALAMNDKWNVMGTEFATMLGLSKPYIYNLVRWYRHAPEPVREAWRDQHPLISQAELERYSHMTNEDALEAWKTRIKMLAKNEPFKPNSKNGKTSSPGRKPRRASVQQIASLQESIDASQLAPEVKALCSNILRFVLGTQKEIPGITDYKKLPRKLIKDKAARA